MFARGEFVHQKSFHCFHLELAVKSIKELVGASLKMFVKYDSKHCRFTISNEDYTIDVKKKDTN